ncbi:accessory gene regulator B family protein [Paenibacillus algorifonticola]|uniref:accessory gene regulator B family protein n=1 Tax=Paenibacillus algorifonticola TaxID=684063 RepID=UPI003D2DE2EC
MSIIVNTSRLISEWLATTKPEEEINVQRLSAILAIKLNNYGVIFSVLIFGYLTNYFWSSCIALVSFIVIRIQTGGFHLKNLDHCFLISLLMLISFSMVELNIWFIVLLNSASIIVVMKYSQRYKFLPCLVISLNFIGLFPAASLSFMGQALTLLINRRWR